MIGHPHQSLLRRVAGSARFALLLAAAAGVPAAQAGEDAAPADRAEAVQACLRGNLPQRTSAQSVRFETRDRMGGSRGIEGKLYWRRGKTPEHSKTLVRVEGPAELRGSAYLVIEKPGSLEIFVYLPEYQKVRRISAHALAGSLFGTDFSYEDMLRLRHVFENEAVSLQTPEPVGDREADVVELVPPPDAGSAYERVRAWVDRETCVPLRMQFYAPGGALAKELTTNAATLSRQGDLWLAQRFLLRDLNEQTETSLELGEIEVDVDLPDRLFSERLLAQGN